jgi:hypothetical protein
MQPLNSDTKNRPRIAFITVFFMIYLLKTEVTSLFYLNS